MSLSTMHIQDYGSDVYLGDSFLGDWRVGAGRGRRLERSRVGLVKRMSMLNGLTTEVNFFILFRSTLARGFRWSSGGRAGEGMPSTARQRHETLRILEDKGILHIE